jgi:hypothetical protein
MVNGEADHRSERGAADPVLLHGELIHVLQKRALKILTIHDIYTYNFINIV